MYACLRRNKKPVCCTRYFLLSTHSFIQHATCKSMSQYIIKRSVRSKTDHDFRHTDASASKYTIANTLVSAESTYYTLQLPTVKCPRRTMTIQISFRVRSRRLSERVEIFAVTVLHPHAHPLTFGFMRIIGVDDKQVRLGKQCIGAEYTVKVFSTCTSQHAFDLFRVHTTKSKTTFLL